MDYRPPTPLQYERRGKRPRRPPIAWDLAPLLTGLHLVAQLATIALLFGYLRQRGGTLGWAEKILLAYVWCIYPMGYGLAHVFGGSTVLGVLLIVLSPIASSVLYCRLTLLLIWVVGRRRDDLPDEPPWSAEENRQADGRVR